MFGDRGENKSHQHQGWRNASSAPSEIVWKRMRATWADKRRRTKKRCGITTISELLHQVRTQKSPIATGRAGWDCPRASISFPAQVSNKRAGGPIRTAPKLMWAHIWTLDYTWGALGLLDTLGFVTKTGLFFSSDFWVQSKLLIGPCYKMKIIPS